MKRYGSPRSRLALALLLAPALIRPTASQAADTEAAAPKAAAKETKKTGAPAKEATKAAATGAADAGSVTIVTHIGGAHAFCRPSLKGRDALVSMFQAQRPEIDAILREAGWPGNPEDLYAAVTKGQFEETQFPVGGTLEWMAIKKKNRPGVLYNVRWAGKKPFDAFQMTVTSGDSKYVFVVPKPCGNLALLSKESIPAPVARLTATPASDCVSRPITIDASGSTVTSGKLAEVKVTATLPDGSTKDLGASSGGFKWTVRDWRQPGTYTISAVAVAESGQRSAPATAKVELKPCPPNCAIKVTFAADDTAAYTDEEFSLDVSGTRPEVGTLKSVSVSVEGPEARTIELSAPFKMPVKFSKPGKYTLRAVAVDDLGQKSTNSCQVLVEVLSRIRFASDWFVGKERRIRPRDFPGGRCAPLLGVRPILGYLVDRRFEVGGAVGFAYNTRDEDHSSFFADLELNYLGKKGFIGGGLGIWDFTHKSKAGDILFQAGLNTPWKTGPRSPVQIFVQGRLLMNQLDDIENNYIFWGGLRFHH